MRICVELVRLWELDLRHLLDQFFSLDIAHAMDTSNTVTRNRCLSASNPFILEHSKVAHGRKVAQVYQRTQRKGHVQSPLDLLLLAPREFSAPVSTTPR